MNNETAVILNDQEFSLADLAGIDMNEVEANYGPENLPPCVVELRVIDAKLEAVKTKGGDGPTKAAVRIETEVVNALSVVDPNIPLESLIGRKHYETYYLTDLAKDLGRVKALLVDSGFQGTGSLTDMLNQFVGHQFICAINNRKDKNDSDIVYANINLKKVKPAA